MKCSRLSRKIVNEALGIFHATIFGLIIGLVAVILVLLSIKGVVGHVVEIYCTDDGD